MNYFDNCTSESERKSRYRELAKKHHPDIGGDAKVMAEINSQYAKPSAGTQFDRANHWEDAFRYSYRSSGFNWWDTNWNEEIKTASERLRRQYAKAEVAPQSCPFCGSVNLTMIQSESQKVHKIKCVQCDATGPSTYEHEAKYSKWNKRI